MEEYKAGGTPDRSIFRLFKISVNYFIFFAVFSLFLIPSLFADDVRFYHQGSTFFWDDNGNQGFLQLQLDHANPPAINTDQILSNYFIGNNIIRIKTWNKYWDFHYSSDPHFLIYCEDWKPYIAIYCPHCKKHLYDYQKDEIIPDSQVKAEDFKPADKDILQPRESDRMVCPIDGSPLNQYEAWAWERKMSLPLFKVWAVSLLTKDKDGNWIGVPYDIKVEDWEGKH